MGLEPLECLFGPSSWVFLFFFLKGIELLLLIRANYLLEILELDQISVIIYSNKVLFHSNFCIHSSYVLQQGLSRVIYILNR